MSVLSGERTIFCEGRKNSLDYKLLSRVVEGITGDKYTIIPAGSKFTFSIFAQGYFFPDEVTNQKYIVFRERDFDAEPTPNIHLLQPSNKLGHQSIALTHRSCVENYLLDTNLIHTYWTAKYMEKQENPISKWGHEDSPGTETITDWIETSARHIQPYQAVRWALGDLLRISTVKSKNRAVIIFIPIYKGAWYDQFPHSTYFLRFNYVSPCILRRLFNHPTASGRFYDPKNC